MFVLGYVTPTLVSVNEIGNIASGVVEVLVVGGNVVVLVVVLLDVLLDVLVEVDVLLVLVDVLVDVVVDVVLVDVPGGNALDDEVEPITTMGV